MKSMFTKLLVAVVAILTGFSAVAGTLDSAPFKIVLPAGWKLADTTAQKMGDDVYLLAAMGKTNSTLKSLVVKTVVDGSSPKALDDLANGMRTTLINPMVSHLSDQAVTFLGYKARRFAYELTANNQSTYNEVLVFAVGNDGWTIAAAGQAGQQKEVEQIFTYYQRRGR
jgi:hypothetical protein